MAVLAVFDDVKADKRLYYLIFGESLLNDGVTCVLFEGKNYLVPVTISQYVCSGFKELIYPAVEPAEVPPETYGYIGGSFVTAPLGGILVGYTVGVLAAVVSKWTEGHFIMILSAVVSYTLAHIFGFSSIISLIIYGITQERYTFDNMKIRQQIDANLIVATVAAVFETFLFLLIGFEMVKLFHELELHYDVRSRFNIFISILMYFLQVLLHRVPRHNRWSAGGHPGSGLCPQHVPV